MTASSLYPLRHPARTHPVGSGKADVIVLTTWKEVARYMGKSVRTVQRWERDFALPVRRPPGACNRRAILALTSDLDAWVALTCSRMQHTLAAEPCGEIASTLRDRVRAAAELRIANRLLLNEINIAMEALQQQLSTMCPAYPVDKRDRANGRTRFSVTLPN